MKNQILLIIVVIFISSNSFSQFKFGVKGGLNYNFAGNVTEVGNSNIFSADNKAGFHLGLWSRISFLGFGLQPEIVYTEFKSKYQLSSRTTLKTKKIDIPVLFDKKLGPIHLFAGPAFQLILNSDFKSSDIGNVDYNKFTLGTQVGLGLEIGNVGVNARWEKGFSNNLTGILISSSTNLNLDNRPNQIILSLHYNLL